MGLLDEIRIKIQEIQEERGLQDHEAFGYWFLEDIEDLSEEEAEQIITDGPWDQGRDAVYIDEEDQRLIIYQFKYSTDRSYTINAFTDIQNAIKAEHELGHLNNSTNQLNCVIVCLTSSDDEIQRKEKQVTRSVKTWLTRNGFSNEIFNLETYDLKKFAQIFEKILGIAANLEFKHAPIMDNNSMVGLINANVFKDYIDREELFAFNIRKFLGKRKGSVNWHIEQTLYDEKERENFWKLNNGIVCIATRFDPDTNFFENLTIVNGAQTITSISKFLESNPIVETPIWVLAKIIIVREDNISEATKLTKTSNTQNPANNKDLRATDISQRRIKDWFEKYFEIRYVFRRGERASRGETKLLMKDLAQAFIAFWSKQPNISFSRPGNIFSKNELYEAAFPQENIDELFRTGTPEDTKNFLLARLLACELLQYSRGKISSLVNEGVVDKKWKSASYHMLWIYRIIFEIEANMENDAQHALTKIWNKRNLILDQTFEGIFNQIVEFAMINQNEIPRDLKSTKFMDDILTKNLLELPRIKGERKKINGLLTS